MSENDALLTALKTQSKKGPDAIYEIPLEKLLPDGRKQYDSLLQHYKVSSMRIFVDRNRFVTTPTVAMGDSIYWHASLNHPPFVLISEYNHRWDEAFVNKMAAEGKIYDPLPDLPRLTKGRVFDEFRAMAQVLGITPLPLVMLSAEENDNYASRTKEGVHYIVIKKNMSEVEQIGTLAHELGHVLKKHNSPASIAAHHNIQDRDEKRELENSRERESDHIASAVLCKGKESIEVMRNMLKDAEAQAAGETQQYLWSRNKVDKDGKLAGPKHPAYQDRIDDMTRDMNAAIKAGTCPAPKRGERER